MDRAVWSCVASRHRPGRRLESQTLRRAAVLVLALPASACVITRATRWRRAESMEGNDRRGLTFESVALAVRPYVEGMGMERGAPGFARCEKGIFSMVHANSFG